MNRLHLCLSNGTRQMHYEPMINREMHYEPMINREEYLAGVPVNQMPEVNAIANTYPHAPYQSTMI